MTGTAAATGKTCSCTTASASANTSGKDGRPEYRRAKASTKPTALATTTCRGKQRNGNGGTPPSELVIDEESKANKTGKTEAWNPVTRVLLLLHVGGNNYAPGQAMKRKRMTQCQGGGRVDDGKENRSMEPCNSRPATRVRWRKLPLSLKTSAWVLSSLASRGPIALAPIHHR